MNCSNHSDPRRGVALVIVLVMLVLMSGIVIGFLSMANTERAGAVAQAGGLAARQLGESAVNLVITQIRDATTAAEDGGTWASQPGAVRTFANDGTGDRVFKLYSADELRVAASAYDPVTESGDLAALQTRPFDLPDGWVDMNEPALARQFESNGNAVTVARFPILDPSAARPLGNRRAPNSPGIVEGFDCAAVEIEDPNSNARIPVLPMPVRWLYVLRDGAIAKAADATLDNPIVGRVAFWTDDESSKVNINTASEGTFWDTPSYSSRVEAGQISNTGQLLSPFDSLNLAVAQPVRNEFQRYPGHPATTSLSPVLSWLWPSDPHANVQTMTNFKEAIYQLAPFVRHYDASRAPTSRSGTAIGVLTSAYGAVGSTTKIPIDETRLFATVDEYMFRPNRSPWDGADTSTNVNNRLPQVFPNMTPDALEKVRFFLTAHSRSPELNLWSKPRVTIWPIHQNTRRRTAFDELFAFCSTVAGKEFFITRTENGHTSPNADFTPRNAAIYTYLKNLLDSRVPGWGTTFRAKYQEDADQILTQIFDYIRCVNLVDTSTTTVSGGYAPYTPKFWVGAPGSSRPADFSGQVTPLTLNIDGVQTRGLGRFPTISEAALICAPLTQSANNVTSVQMILAFETYVANPGFPAIKETFSVRVDREDDVRVVTASGQSIQANFPVSATNIVNLDGSHEPIGRAYMPNRGWANSFWYFSNPSTNARAAKTLSKASAGTPNIALYPFISDPIPVTGGTFFLEGGTFRVQVFASLTGTGVPVHTYRIRLFNRRTPATPTGLAWPTWTRTFQERISNMGVGESSYQDSDVGFIRSGDVVRSVEYIGPARTLNQQGDFRHAVAAVGEIPPEHFAERGGSAPSSPFYSNTRLVHGLKTCNGNRYHGHTAAGIDGRLSQNSPVRADRHTKIPTNVNGVQRADGGWGDWDRGISKTVDGAYGGRPDEGNAYFDLGSTSESYRMPYYHGARFIDPGQSYFSPNRMLSSPVMFGSLPTGVKRGLPWQTLLFRPDRPAPGEREHPGRGNLPDHLLLDLFHMPVVEPYAISEPFSTAGKINLNYEIAPWGYGRIGSKAWVKRDTALRAVLKAVKIMAVPGSADQAAHQEHALDAPHGSNSFRYDIDLQRTLGVVQTMLDNGKAGIVERNGIFRSASQICDIDLFPAGLSMGLTDAQIGQFWYNHRLTGDNQRERPYSHIYPRITTRSNVYNVHVRAQTVRIKPQAYGPDGKLIGGVLKESDVQTQSEYRGSSIIERFLDPNDKALEGYNENAPGREGSLEPYYRFRVVATKRFSE